MGDIYFTPVTGFLFGLFGTLWLALVGWFGWRWLIRAWHWPWPIVFFVQGVLAAQIFWLFRLMDLNAYFLPTFQVWLNIPGGLLFWLATFPWFLLSNLFSFTPLAVRLGMYIYPDLIDMVVDYCLFFLAINGLLLYLVTRKKRLQPG